jgi:predicted anti-sigma-YlaC factor YlaD
VSAPHELTCRELVELVTDYLEGAMPPADRVVLEQHLVFCKGCETYLEQMRDTMRVVGALREEDVPPHAADVLLRTFRDWKGRR